MEIMDKGRTPDEGETVEANHDPEQQDGVNQEEDQDISDNKQKASKDRDLSPR